MGSEEAYFWILLFNDRKNEHL